MGTPNSYEYLVIDESSVFDEAKSLVWDASNFEIIGLQIILKGLDDTITCQLETSLNKEVWDTYETPYDAPAGDSSHSYMVGIFSGRFVRLAFSGAASSGTFKMLGYGKV